MVGLLVYDNVERHVYFTLRNTIMEVAGSVDIEKAILVAKPPPGPSILNITLMFENPTGIDLTLVSFSAKLLDWYLWEIAIMNGHGRCAWFAELGFINFSMKPIQAYSKVYFTLQLPLSQENVDVIAQSGYRIWPALWGSASFQGLYFYKNLTDGITYLGVPDERPSEIDVEVEPSPFKELEEARLRLRGYTDELGLCSCYIDGERRVLHVVIKNLTVDVEGKIRNIVGDNINAKIWDREAIMEMLYDAKIRVIDNREKLRVAVSLENETLCFVDYSGYLVVATQKDIPDSEMPFIRKSVRETIGEDIPLLIFRVKY